MLERIILMDIGLAYLIDLAVGDPPRFPHPVRWIGWLISRMEGIFRPLITVISQKYRIDQGRVERILGSILAITVVSVTFWTVFVLLEGAKALHPWLYHGLNIYFISSAFAARCLADEALKVHRPLVENNLAESRKRVGMLVARETRQLDEKGVIRAVVETTAENTVDGVLAPIFFTILGAVLGIAAPLVYAFKAASTLDSMVGYRNERYLNFGRFSAKLDDVLNYVPARLSGLIIPGAAFLCGKGFKKSFRIMWRDRRKHQSPNCAYPEAAVAGALGVQLGGNNVYFGKTVEKPVIGALEKPLETRDITDTVKIMLVASAITILAGCGVLLIGAGLVQ